MAIAMVTRYSRQNLVMVTPFDGLLLLSPQVRVVVSAPNSLINTWPGQKIGHQEAEAGRL
jgi:hypothetical protein